MSSISQSNKFSKIKAESLLKSFMLYRVHCENYNVLATVKKGIGNNFLSFIYEYYGFFSELTKRAEKEFHSLGYEKKWPVGGENFKIIAKVVGFKTALKFKHALSNIKS